MTWHWKELLPVDRFSVRTSQYMSEIDRLTLTLLYQPLTGALAHSLYVTLMSQLERDQYWSSEQTHRQLMLLLGVSLEIIYEERKKLEAIGLLKTYKRKDEDGSTYVYELQPPMTPKQFFENDVLSVYLFNRLGKTHYRHLRERFMLDALPLDEYVELTYAFDEVYASLHHSEMVSSLQSETGKALQLNRDKALISRDHNEEILFENQQFDFELLEKSLSKSVVPEGFLTDDVKKLIGRLAFVYRMEPLEMSSVLQQVLIHDDKIDPNELRKRAQEWYKVEHGKEPPALGFKTQPEKHRTMSDREPANDEERAVKFYETTAPLSLLEIRSDGSRVPDADLKIVESLIIDHQLLPGVVNVLLDFVLWSQDMKLSKSLIDKIAGHWARKKVQTVQEAMQLVLLEQKKATNPKTRTSNNWKATSNRQKQPRRDKLPKWLVAEKQKEQQAMDDVTEHITQVTQHNPSSDEKSFEQMLEELRRSKEEKGER